MVLWASGLCLAVHSAFYPWENYKYFQKTHFYIYFQSDVTSFLCTAGKRGFFFYCQRTWVQSELYFWRIQGHSRCASSVTAVVSTVNETTELTFQFLTRILCIFLVSYRLKSTFFAGSLMWKYWQSITRQTPVAITVNCAAPSKNINVLNNCLSKNSSTLQRSKTNKHLFLWSLWSIFLKNPGFKCILHHISTI